MSDAIGSVFIIMALLTIPMAIIGLIAPARFARPGGSAPKRTTILLTMTLAFLVFMILGVSLVSPPPKETPLAAQDNSSETPAPDVQFKAPDTVNPPRAQGDYQQSDQQAVHQIMQTIVTQDAAMNGHWAIVQEALSLYGSHKRNSREAAAQKFQSGLIGLEKELEQARKIQMPEIHHHAARQHIQEAIDARRRWCITKQAQIALIVEGKVDEAIAMKSDLDSLTAKTALAMVMAHDDLGMTATTK